jgi:hypothetical protein
MRGGAALAGGGGAAPAKSGMRHRRFKRDNLLR